ncbi:DUF6950 family protein [Bowmanella dokdonensis]|uniref:DUF6950 domain-containing protein n=1 Tax=Bowmanella dokdonensis TaxID=751969 RepID=A0A939DME1_9ALTE|nr:hypothetical protein [Bowmanella dokdonensis]MBN7824785.1 hypothetical protein [Bowmanella dokdonensis]
MSVRLPNWELVLANYLNECQAKPFEWGQHDCCLFAANAVLAFTGQDYAAAFRGRYSTELGAARALKRYGAGTLKQTLLRVLGEPVPLLQVSRGDVLLVTVDGRDSAAVFYQGAWAVSLQGLIPVLMQDVQLAWRVC